MSASGDVTEEYTDVTRRLIAAVREHPVLYDKEHRQYRTVWERDRVWARISRTIGISGNLAKKKWRNLRDCYAKHLKMLHSAQARAPGAKYKSWHLAAEMDFMRQHACFTRRRATAGGVRGGGGGGGEEEETSHGDDDLWQEPKRRRQLLPAPPHRAAAPAPPPPRALRPAPPLDATEHIFLGYAKLVRGFAPRRRAEVKLKVAQLMSEAEMAELADEADEVMVEVESEDPLQKAVSKFEPDDDEEELD